MAASTAAENADRGPAVMGILWTESAISLIITALRFYARGMIRRIGWDDWLMALTTALFVSCAGLVTAQASVGGYRHEQFLSTENAIYALKINFILRGVDILAYATGKASIGALILRIIGHQNRWQRAVVWVVIVLTALLNVLNTIFNFVQCHPVSANWDRSGSFKCWPAKAQVDFAYFMSAENVVADVILAVIPATFLSRLKSNIRRRISLSILLGLGSMASVCGIVKMTQLNSLSGVSDDFTWGEYGLTVWGVSEIFVIIVTGCIPTLKPIWDRCSTRGKDKDKSFQLSDTGKTNYRTVALDGYINLPEGKNTSAKLIPFPTKMTPASSSPTPFAGDVDDDTRHSASIDQFRPTTQSPVTHAYEM